MLLDLAEVSLLSGGYQLKKFLDPELALKRVQQANPEPLSK